MQQRVRNATSRRHFLTRAAAMGAALAASQEPASLWTFAADTGILPRSIHPFPNQITWSTGALFIRHKAALAVSPDSDAGAVEMLRDTWQRFTLGAVELTVTRDPALRNGEFALERARPPQRQSAATYALQVDATGVGASATDVVGMRHAWFTLLQLLDADNTADGGIEFSVPQVTVQDWPVLTFRGLHVCVFHETPPLMIEKAIRLAAFFKFTHVVLEFWGMLRLEAMKELSWPEAWSKEQAGQMVSLARSMGLEVIPMFNCWGHAPASRIKHGRHVVLDQNAQLTPLFEPDGWT